MTQFENQPWKCIEWFSGIGGMHYALQDSGCFAQIVASFDIKQIANEVYYHNFLRKPITKNIEYLTVEYVNAFKADVWLMSPPCQPFTQGGKQRDDADMRSKGFLHLINILGQLNYPPKFIFLENVPFFEISNCHRMFKSRLAELGFEMEEYMISPTDPMIAMPNRRKRYYMAARHRSLLNRFAFPRPFISERIVISLDELNSPCFSDLPEPRSLASYIRPDANDDPQYQVPLDYLQSAKNFKFDIVKSTDNSCATFTKAYGSKYVIGTGSFLQTQLLDLSYETDDQEVLPKLGLRFFTPLEIAELQGFPISSACKNTNASLSSHLFHFEFPEDISLIQKYRLLGNSLNVKVVSFLLRRLLTLDYREHSLIS